MNIRALNPVRIVELILVLVLIFLLGKFVFGFVGNKGMAIAPTDTRPVEDIDVRKAPKIDTSILGRFDPFHRETTITTIKPSEDDVPETSLNLKVFGMRADLGGDSSSAIIQTPDNKQANYLVGEEIIPGVTLERVDIDYVILDRNGEKERLSREGRAKGDAANQMVNISQAQLAFKASDMVNDLSFYPYREGKNVVGYKVRSRRGGSLKDFGFERNDIITSINGQSLTQSRVNLPMLWKNFKLARYASIQIIRDDVPMSIEVNLK